MAEEKAPALIVAEWVQGKPSSIENEPGKVILLEVFQVNCPGCFLGGIPEVIDLHNKYKDKGLVVWGLATAFEDFDKNNLDNLKRLLDNGEVVGETLAYLDSRDMLSEGRLQYKIPFPVAWDSVVSRNAEASDQEVDGIISRDIEDVDSLPPANMEKIRQQVKGWLKQKKYDSNTFDLYKLRGTPSTILIDKRGCLRYKLFGFGQGLEGYVKKLLGE
jgi:hypothetical protein